MNKEYSFAKICERTSKESAYEQALTFAEQDRITLEEVVKFLKEKKENHSDFLFDAGMRYEFCTQNIEIHYSIRTKANGSKKNEM